MFKYVIRLDCKVCKYDTCTLYFSAKEWPDKILEDDIIRHVDHCFACRRKFHSIEDCSVTMEYKIVVPAV